MIQISFIIPCYNVDQWVKRCVNSILDQALQSNSYEIILVNDGSTDSTLQIIQTMEKEYSNLVVVTQSNKGLSNARNTGIRHSKGKYITFVDADDYLQTNTIKSILEFMVSLDLDLGMFSQKYIIGNDFYIRGISTGKNETGIKSGSELYFLRTSDSACKYFIRRENLIKNRLYFYEEIKFLEDAEFAPRLHFFSKRCAFRNIPYYNYEIREGSLITSKSAVSMESINGYYKAVLSLKKFKIENFTMLNSLRLGMLNNVIAKFSLLPLIIIISNGEWKTFRFVIKYYKRSNIGNIDLKNLKGRRYLHAKLCNVSPYLFSIYFIFELFYLKVSKRGKRISMIDK